MKKLSRLVGDRKIAGLCAGLGEYFDIDPVIVRLFFVFSVFFGGLGVLAYVIMWVLVPQGDDSPAERAARPRLRLSSSDRKIAGVCGGLGEYFALDPVFFRVGFVLLAFTCGIGLFLYVVLWLLVPRAPTPASGEVIAV
jgi:phage shock protein PspC (stress-responsive transcriptional regulator)